MEIKKEPAESPSLPRGAVGRGGIPIGRKVRLPSIRTPRDLTLGNTTKRVFQPKIPVRREKKETKVEKTVKHEGKRESPKNSKGRGRPKQEFIQMPGTMFGEGIFVPPKAARSRDTSKGSQSQLTKPVIKRDEENGNIIKLKRADYDTDLWDSAFVDDSDEFGDIKLQNPTVIPINSKFKGADIEEGGDSVKIKTEACLQESYQGVGNKSSGVKMEPLSPGKSTLLSDVAVGNVTIEKLISDLNINDSSAAENMIFFRLPVYVQDPYTAAKADELKQKASNSADATVQHDLTNNTTLSDLSDGYIGKLQLLSSGKSRLVLGSQVLDVIQEKLPSDVKEVVAMQNNGSITNMTVIGHIQHNFTCIRNYA